MKFSEVLKGLIQDLLRIAVRKLFLAPLTSGFSAFLEGKASGGPVSAGTPYMVGEEGPEMFVPRSSGNIIPNGGGLTIQQAFHVQAGLPPQWQQQMATVTQIAAGAAHEAVSRQLAGRR
jgi:hypothetical protein